MDLTKPQSHLAWVNEGIEFLGEQGKGKAMMVKKMVSPLAMTLCCAYCDNQILFHFDPTSKKELSEQVHDFLIASGWYIQGDDNESWWDCCECYNEDIDD